MQKQVMDMLEIFRSEEKEREKSCSIFLRYMNEGEEKRWQVKIMS